MRFEILLPTTYVDPEDPSETPQFVQYTEVIGSLNELTAKYKQLGGYTISNPFAPPPFAGAYEGGPQERSFWVMILIPDHQLNAAERDIQRMVRMFQEKYHQVEILAYHHPVNRYVPLKP